jgi:beta-lactamase class A
MLRLGRAAIACTLACALLAPVCASATAMPGPLADLKVKLASASVHAPGHIALEIKDLATGYATSINPYANMPAASTIKIPVMVEVFRQMAAGAFDLNHVMHLQPSDRDWGWGDLAGAPTGTTRTVNQLLRVMIEQSDNTATNMLIRLVGRARINLTMETLGLETTRLGDYIRSDGDIRTLRTSPHDMTWLLESIARAQLVDVWSSREMLAILTGQTHNGLIPAPLPRGLAIAHKTGTLHDTLNDVGIVYLRGEPYVIAVMTTHLPSLALGRGFIRRVSRLTFSAFERLERWREDSGLPAFAAGGATVLDGGGAQPSQPLAPDLQMWTTPGDTSAAPPGAAVPAQATTAPPDAAATDAPTDAPSPQPT